MLQGISVFAAATVSMVAATGALAAQKVSISHEHKAGELLVKLKDGQVGKAEAQLYSNLLRAFGSNSVLSIKPLITDKSIQVVRMAKDENLASAIATLKADASVKYAEPNYIMRAFDDTAPPTPPSEVMPNDPSFGLLWGMHNTGQTDAAGQVGKERSDINVLPLWQEGITGSKSVLVAIIDTGIDWTHPDLKDNLYTNMAEVAGDGVDNDANGFVDDIHGWNFVNNTADSRDDNNHGSHCAGTIGGVGNNGIGVVGVNWNVSLMPVKFLSAEGSGTLDAAVNAINYATMMHVNVMSNSWGGGGYTDSLKDAIVKARDAGITFVAAAGNDSNDNDASPTYPAGYDVENVISVAATDNQDKIAYFSNYGAKTVSVAAPGVKVYSSVKGGGYDTFSGTSMATPHVSGIAALLLSTDASMSYAMIKERLIKTSDPVSGLKRKSASHGRVNAYAAIHNIVPPSEDPDGSLWMTATTMIETAHPYADNSTKTFELSHPGAKYLRVKFAQVDVEQGYDHLLVSGPDGAIADDITGTFTDYMSEYVKADHLTLTLQSDSSVNGYGFRVIEYQYIP